MGIYVEPTENEHNYRQTSEKKFALIALQLVSPSPQCVHLPQICLHARVQIEKNDHICAVISGLLAIFHPNVRLYAHIFPSNCTPARRHLIGESVRPYSRLVSSANRASSANYAAVCT